MAWTRFNSAIQHLRIFEVSRPISVASSKSHQAGLHITRFLNYNCAQHSTARPFHKIIRQGRLLSTSASNAASPVGRRTCSEGALSFSGRRLASGIAGIAGRLAFGLEGDIMGGLSGDLGIARSLLGFRGGIAGGLFGGLTGNAPAGKRCARQCAHRERR